MSRRIHPAFQTKTVIKLECKYCERRICARGMRALLLADTKVELYSTDLPPEKWVWNSFRPCIGRCLLFISSSFNFFPRLFQFHSVDRNGLLDPKLWMSNQGCRLSWMVRCEIIACSSSFWCSRFRISCWLPNFIPYTPFVLIFSGNVVGYHVTLPCQSCIRSCNNGHFWMFHSSAVHPVERLDQTGMQHEKYQQRS